MEPPKCLHRKHRAAAKIQEVGLHENMKPTPQLKVDTEQAAGCITKNLPVSTHTQHTYIPCAFCGEVRKDRNAQKKEWQVP